MTCWSNSALMAKRGRQPLTIHVSTDELQAIEQAAGVAGLSPQEYVLQCAKIMSKRQGQRPYTSSELQVISRERTDWTEDEVHRRGLPLYWAEAWFRRQIAAGHTLREIAVQSGQPARSVSEYARRVYGYEVKVAAVAQDVQQQAREMVASGMSRQQVAAQLGLTAASIGTYALGLPDERQKRLRARIEQAGPWPATTQEIGLRVFGGDKDRAAKWAHEMVKAGKLKRVQRGVYDMAQAAYEALDK